jgi:dienelactone hydrolase
MDCLLTPPPVAPFDSKIIAEQDRGSYVAKKVVFNLTGDSRVLGFLLVPKSAGPHPAVLLLHDHGAKFDIGKEKVISHEDLRAAEFLSTRPGADPKRVAAIGLSVGGFRTWQLAALSDRVSAGVSVCWMATRKGLMAPRNNQTTGQSAFTMTHPGLATHLDYPDVASLACPKPMMFLCGNRDKLFPVESIEESFAKLRKVWESQKAADRLATRLYDAPHEFNTAMQDEAFAWLDRQFGIRK